MDRKNFLRTLLGGAAVAATAPAALAKINESAIPKATNFNDMGDIISLELFSKEWVTGSIEEMSTCTHWEENCQWRIGDLALCDGRTFQCTAVDYVAGIATFTPLHNI